MRITNNIMAMNTHRFYTNNNNAVSKSAEKLSSGFRVNRAGDDAAGLAISEKMRAQIRGLSMAKKNAQDGVSLIQTAEGALDEVHSMLQRMSELAVQSASDTNQTCIDREALQAEVDQLLQEIDQISTTAKFNDMTILDGSYSSTAFKIQVGANTGDDNLLEIKIDAMNVSGLGLSGLSGTGIMSQTSAHDAIQTIRDAINTVSTQRADLGAAQNRLEHKISNLANMVENLSSAESRIRDIDMASEMTSFTKNNILSQAATAMLAQANALPQNVLSLLG